jgi:hypothetical protein
MIRRRLVLVPAVEREHARVVERTARDQLYPPSRSVDRNPLFRRPADAPLNEARPRSVGSQGDARTNLSSVNGQFIG